MKARDRHLSRAEILKMAGSDEPIHNVHLANCRQCREEVDLVKKYLLAGKSPLPDAPRIWIDKAVAIARPEPVPGKIVRLLANLIFDSWAAPHPVGVRGDKSAAERRVRFESKGMIFDLRGEKNTEGWDFIGEIPGGDYSSPEIVLKAGNKTITADSNGLFQWSCKTAPKKIILSSTNIMYELPELKWNIPRRK